MGKTVREREIDKKGRHKKKEKEGKTLREREIDKKDRQKKNRRNLEKGYKMVQEGGNDCKREK